MTTTNLYETIKRAIADIRPVKGVVILVPKKPLSYEMWKAYKNDKQAFYKLGIVGTKTDEGEWGFKITKASFYDAVREDGYEDEDEYIHHTVDSSTAYDHYATIGVTKHTPLNEILTTCKQLMRDYHPDTLSSKDLPASLRKDADNRLRKILKAFAFFKDLSQK